MTSFFGGARRNVKSDPRVEKADSRIQDNCDADDAAKSTAKLVRCEI